MTDILIPSLSENISSGTVIAVSVKANDTVTKGQTLLELETDKAVLEVPSPVDGIIAEVLVTEGAVVSVGQLVFRASTDITSGPQAQPATAPLSSENATPPAPQPQSPPPAPVPEQHPPQAAPAAVPAGQTADPEGEISIEPLSALRQTIAGNITQAWSTIPHVTHFAGADMTGLEKLRQEYVSQNNKTSVLPFLMKIVADALKEFPRFNASLDMVNRTVICKKYYNIGVAVDTPQGLIVPVIRHVDQKSILELNEELKRAAERARARTLTPEDLKEGTFTISNLGSITGGHFTPIIKNPETAILGISKAKWELVCGNDGRTFASRLILPLSLSYDHRIIDGADGARFIKRICDAVERM